VLQTVEMLLVVECTEKQESLLWRNTNEFNKIKTFGW
jgi:hypothetical protein